MPRDRTVGVFGQGRPRGGLGPGRRFLFNGEKVQVDAPSLEHPFQRARTPGARRSRHRRARPLPQHVLPRRERGAPGFARPGLGGPRGPPGPPLPRLPRVRAELHVLGTRLAPALRPTLRPKLPKEVRERRQRSGAGPPAGTRAGLASPASGGEGKVLLPAGDPSPHHHQRRPCFPFKTKRPPPPPANLLLIVLGLWSPQRCSLTAS